MKVRLDLIRARKSLGLTQAELAKLVDLSRVQLNRIENGKMVPHPATWVMLCEVLGLGPDRVVDQDGEEGPVFDADS